MYLSWPRALGTWGMAIAVAMLSTHVLCQLSLHSALRPSQKPWGGGREAQQMLLETETPGGRWSAPSFTPCQVKVGQQEFTSAWGLPLPGVQDSAAGSGWGCDQERALLRDIHTLLPTLHPPPEGPPSWGRGGVQVGLLEAEDGPPQQPRPPLANVINCRMPLTGFSNWYQLPLESAPSQDRVKWKKAL